MLLRILGIMICFLAHSSTAAVFKLGIENISDTLTGWLRSQRVALVTNHTGKNQNGIPTSRLLLDKGIRLTALLTPEHGLDGTVTAGKSVADSYDVVTSIPIKSLYGHGTGKKVAPALMDDNDVFIIDMQDGGMRHYTYISTLMQVLQSASEYNKYVIVLDRPNPLGYVMEGPLVHKELLSFISIAPIPLRHGMTIGELAYYFNAYCLPKAAKLHVVPMQNYQRGMCYDVHKLSPNIANKESCHGYSFLGLLGEVRPFNVGVGTDKAFQSILLPASLGIKDEVWKKLQSLLVGFKVQSRLSTHFNECKKKWYTGLHLSIKDINELSAFSVCMAILTFFKNHGVVYTFSPSFDRAVGTHAVQAVVKGEKVDQELENTVNKNLHTFLEQAKKVCIYAPLPQIRTI